MYSVSCMVKFLRPSQSSHKTLPGPFFAFYALFAVNFVWFPAPPAAAAKPADAANQPNPYQPLLPPNGIIRGDFYSPPKGLRSIRLSDYNRLFPAPFSASFHWTPSPFQGIPDQRTLSA